MWIFDVNFVTVENYKMLNSDYQNRGDAIVHTTVENDSGYI